MINRRKTRVITVGRLNSAIACKRRVNIGEPHPVSVQSMTTTSTEDIAATVKQIKQLEKAGCEIIRVAVLNQNEAFAIKEIRKNISIPLVADIHFNYRLALSAIDSGADCIRINPGNIYREKEIAQVAKEARYGKIPVRIGVNSGSLKNLSGAKKSNVDLMIENALMTARLFEKEKFYDIIISLKSSDLFETIAAYKKIAVLCDYPLHLGITAAGLPETGIIKSSIGIGFLLLDGIGDTIRVSLTGDPVKEVEAGKQILLSLRLRNFGPEIISCPTCGRCKVDLPLLVRTVEKSLKSLCRRYKEIENLKVAVMGCEVNGPGEAKEADVGVACFRGGALLFAKGKKIKKIKLNEIKNELLGHIKNEMVN